MKRSMILLMVCMTGLLAMAGTAWPEEAAWFDATENWLIRVYTTPNAGADYTVALEVLDTGNHLVTDTIVGLATNPLLIAGNAGSPDISLAFDETTATAYVIYTAGGGGVSLQPVPDIIKGGALIAVTPDPVSYGLVRVRRSLDKTVTVQNTGTAPMHFTSIGTPGAPFSTVGAGTTCVVGTPVGVGGNCTIVVRFAPIAATTYDSGFGIISGAGNVTVKLSGTGTTTGGL